MRSIKGNVALLHDALMRKSPSPPSATLCAIPKLASLSNLAKGSDLTIAHHKLTITSSEPKLILY